MKVLLGNSESISVGGKNRFFQYGGSKKYTDRPGINVTISIDDFSGITIHYFLKDHLHDWLVEQNSKYSFKIENIDDFDSNWYIDIPDSYVAIMFKLIWF